MTRIVVAGSVNLDLVAAGAPLPKAGETVTGAVFARHPGGKGANQALAARRLGAEAALVARVGRDALADEALALLRAGGVDLTGVTVDDEVATGVALIAVDAQGENQITVAPGANAALTPDRLALPAGDALICQLELPPATVARAAQASEGFFCVNLAPAAPVDPAVIARADLIVVNEGEAAFYGGTLHQARGLVAVTHGARGAALLRGGVEVARAAPPAVTAMDTTGAGDAFVAALVVALLEGVDEAAALRFACAAGACAATRAGAQSSLPTRAAVEALLAG
ncbi:MAG: PfkB family carbohydrate kinase [Hyphomonadaceae bacterium]|nr:PfkB family carbohydrate kinase [Hyphomonadaceae bacterium]